MLKGNVLKEKIDLTQKCRSCASRTSMKYEKCFFLLSLQSVFTYHRPAGFGVCRKTSLYAEHKQAHNGL